nr:hypothetical protein [Paludibacteraceae bacterium]
SNQAAIGGGNEGGEGVNNSAGTITIYGGKVTATSWAGAGIGGGQGSDGGTINIHGGTITAQGGMASAAIGGGSGCTGFTVNIYGGTINATSGANAAAIGGGEQSTGGTVNIHGGNITANAIDYGGGSTDGFGIGSGASYTSPTTVNLYEGIITATSYNGTLNLKTKFVDTGGVSWPAANNVSTKPDNKTLKSITLLAANPANGDYWTTFYCGHTGYKIDDAENAYAYTATVSSTTITLHKLGKVIPAGTAVIIVGADNSISMTASTDQAEHTVDNSLHGVDVATPVSTVLGTYSAEALYMLSKKNDNLGFYRLSSEDVPDVPARKAFLALDNTQAALAPQLNMVFEDATDMQPVLEAEENELWFTVDGRLIGRKPTQSGIYISKGKKIFVK